MHKASRSKKQKHNSIHPLHALITCVVVLGFIVLAFRSTHAPDDTKESVQNDPITITLVGDIMFDRGVERNIDRYYGGDYNALFTNTPYLTDADITFGNLEGPVATGGRNVGSEYSFRMNPLGLTAMRTAGFDIVSFANNHVGDYTVAAFTETLSRLTENGILYTGAGHNKTEALTPVIFSIRGMKIGFLGSTDVGPMWMKATDTSPGIVVSNDAALVQAVKDADATVDVLIVSFHWGNEYSPANARQQTLAHQMIDAGADIIVGHHPHVMERIEVYKDKPIFYSLGNFIFDQYFSEHTMRGMVATISISPDTKKISYEAFISALNKQFIPQALAPFSESFLVQKTFQP